MSERVAWGAGLAWTTPKGNALDFWCPEPHLGQAPGNGQPWPGAAGLAELAGEDPVRLLSRRVCQIAIDLDAPPARAEDAYLRLQLLSHRLVAPNQLNLEGIFGVLANVVWTSAGPCQPTGFEQTRARLELAGRGPVRVYGVDKFPAMTDYVVPTGVRIADSARVRLGAYLAPGTTVMHEGFVNFNAGTLGESMVEGRVSQGVTVADGADIGGGASIMGTLSGGGRSRITIGPRSLIGANAGIGISLGADCVVEAGLYVTAGTKVTVLSAADAARPPHASTTANPGAQSTARVVKAAELSGQDGWLFRRNSLTGTVEAVPRGTAHGPLLNAALHSN
ncbi:MAG: 2,3,4,5-tetrahydropyridine-2,6-dicarboxylate N-succinyltransferase [Bifidobacteriaceae bacterium]|jgi:2,3,4,5-tetrahydropyridine-2-carboxylate N-succinyltransferase|nr:2,3,4,5-tetrahydropyridine-2,6-dicarboxylate N-succinyltransferase [Bifidobacteriaceae bacterium]